MVNACSSGGGRPWKGMQLMHTPHTGHAVRLASKLGLRQLAGYVRRAQAVSAGALGARQRAYLQQQGRVARLQGQQSMVAHDGVIGSKLLPPQLLRKAGQPPARQLGRVPAAHCPSAGCSMSSMPAQHLAGYAASDARLQTSWGHAHANDVQAPCSMQV